MLCFYFQVSSSVAMEKEGLKRNLENLQTTEPRLEIATLATDRHKSVIMFKECHFI